MTFTGAERETIVRWDEEDRRLFLYTASPRQAARWRKRGYTLAVFATDRNGRATGWHGTAPMGSITFRSQPLRRGGGNLESLKKANPRLSTPSEGAV